MITLFICIILNPTFLPHVQKVWFHKLILMHVGSVITFSTHVCSYILCIYMVKTSPRYFYSWILHYFVRTLK